MKRNFNDQKFILKLIIIVVIILIITIIALICIQNITNTTSEEDKTYGNNTLEEGEKFSETYGSTEDKKIDKQSYFDVSTCVRSYLEAINIKNDSNYTYDENGNYVLAVEEKIIKEKIYNLLSKNYVKQNDITIDNLYEKIQTIETNALFVPLEISKIQNSNIKSFLAYGLLESTKDYHVIDDIYIVVNIDIASNIFSIHPIEGKYSKIEDIKVDNLDTSIEKNTNNTFIPSYARYEEIVKDYINVYKRLALGKPEIMYELLNEEYRLAKFGSLENFKQYIEKNRTQIMEINAQKYQVNRRNDSVQYVCIDQNEKYYIFEEIEPLKFSTILDTYTIDMPEFTQKYKNASNEEKVVMNVNKFISAINDKDYSYAYSKLDQTFKNNNFGSLEQFENYVKNNFFNANAISAESVKEQGGVYICNITISDKNEQNQNKFTKNFVMQLNDGTNFVMSFGV